MENKTNNMYNYETVEKLAELVHDKELSEITIKEICDRFENGSIGNMPMALSYSIETGEMEFKQISWAGKTRVNSEVIKITTDDGKIIKCTPDHKIYTSNRGYVKAKDLSEDDDLVTF